MKIKELIEKRNELVNQIANAKTNEELDALELDIRKIDIKIAEMKKVQEPSPEEKEAEERAKAVPAPVEPGIKTPEVKMDLEKLAAEIRSGKEVTITAEQRAEIHKRALASSSTMAPTAYKSELEPADRTYAQAIDLVKMVPMTGAAKYEVAFGVDTGDADYTAEGGEYTTTEGTFNTNDTGVHKITASSVVNEEVKDLNTIDYLSAVVSNVEAALRKKASKDIIAGDGTSNHLLGAINAPAKVMPESYKLEVSAFDKTTLRKIVMAYGGDEDVTSPLTLFLNKATLNEFLAVENKNGDPIYKVTFEGTGGVISEANGGLQVPYSINSGLAAFSAAEVNKKFMVYGDPMKYEVAEFAPVTVSENDYIYQNKGQIAFFGKWPLGGVVVAYKAFLPIVKVTG